MANRIAALTAEVEDARRELDEKSEELKKAKTDPNQTDWAVPVNGPKPGTVAYDVRQGIQPPTAPMPISDGANRPYRPVFTQDDQGNPVRVTEATRTAEAAPRRDVTRVTDNRAESPVEEGTRRAVAPVTEAPRRTVIAEPHALKAGGAHVPASAHKK